MHAKAARGMNRLLKPGHLPVFQVFPLGLGYLDHRVDPIRQDFKWSPNLLMFFKVFETRTEVTQKLHLLNDLSVSNNHLRLNFNVQYNSSSKKNDKYHALNIREMPKQTAKKILVVSTFWNAVESPVDLYQRD